MLLVASTVTELSEQFNYASNDRLDFDPLFKK